jgi:hypothetical protein
VEGRFVIVIEVSVFGSALRKSGSAVRPRLLYAHRVALGPLAVYIAGKKAISEWSEW